MRDTDITPTLLTDEVPSPGLNRDSGNVQLLQNKEGADIHVLLDSEPWYLMGAVDRVHVG